MSKEYPCVFYENERCTKAEDGVDDFCVMGPCTMERPSNADRIRAMSDEELAMFLLDIELIADADVYRHAGVWKSWWLDWLRQEAE